MTTFQKIILYVTLALVLFKFLYDATTPNVVKRTHRAVRTPHEIIHFGAFNPYLEYVIVDIEGYEYYAVENGTSGYTLYPRPPVKNKVEVKGKAENEEHHE